MSQRRAPALGRTGNPALSKEVFIRAGRALSDTDAMTVGGTVNRAFFLLLLLVLSAAYLWREFYAMPDASGLAPWILAGFIGGFILALIIIFRKRTAPYLSPVYAILEGLAIGGLSKVMEIRYPGIVIQAVALTFGTLLVLLAAYKSGLIKATENFKLGVVSATGAVALIYVATFVLGFFGIGIPYIHDFDFIESGAENGAPKFMEWYAAFGLMVTLIWLYLEILRLLAKSRGRK
jgi:uncharacterized YccA/Bax inhibitor family protein